MWETLLPLKLQYQEVQVHYYTYMTILQNSIEWNKYVQSD